MLFRKSRFVSKSLFLKKKKKTLRGSNWVQSRCFPRDLHQLEECSLPPCPAHLSGRQSPKSGQIKPGEAEVGVRG